MRQLIELLSSVAANAARMPSGLPIPPPGTSTGATTSIVADCLINTTTRASAVPPQQQQLRSGAAEPPLLPLPLSMSAAAAARHPALHAAEAALCAKLEHGAAGCDQDYLQLHILNEQLAETHSFAVAEQRRELNRYCDVLPYDNHRILLGQPGATSAPTRSGCSNSSRAAAAEGPTSYINASPLYADDGRSGTACSYIAAQGPLRHTRDAFWQMVVEQQCSAVLMLTRTVERGVQKCAPYFAEPARMAKSMGRFVVSTASVEELLPDLTRRTLYIKDTQQAQQQRPSVHHYHFTAWPDHGVPPSPAPLLRLCRELRDSSAHSAPILVHCSAGIGRSGVFIVLDVITRRLLALRGSRDEAAGAAAVDVAHLVAELRQQRLGMVQTRDQFVFCHTALLHFVRQLAEESGGEQREQGPSPQALRPMSADPATAAQEEA